MKNGLIARDEAVVIPDEFAVLRTADGRMRPSLRCYTLNELPQPQVLFTFGFSNLKPAPSRVST
jgi:hypothetical protein